MKVALIGNMTKNNKERLIQSSLFSIDYVIPGERLFVEVNSE